MFKREIPLSPLAKVKEMFWPSMGFVRMAKYIHLRITRLADTSHKIAAGLAIGVSVSFTPFVGVHFVQAGFFSFILRTNLMAALVGTFVGNPWTFPFMWWAAIALGSVIFNALGLPANTALPDEMSFQILLDLIANEPLRIFLPWLVGGYILAVATWPISYFIFYHMVKGAKIARRKARLHKVRQVAKDITSHK